MKSRVCVPSPKMVIGVFSTARAAKMGTAAAYCTRRSTVEWGSREAMTNEETGAGRQRAAWLRLGLLAVTAGVLYLVGVRDWLLLYFFSAIGLHADLRTLISGGKPLAILLVLASLFILLQNLVGMGIASAFDMDPKAGLMVGSISLTGGVGTALAWAPTFIEELGVANALELGVAANTAGLIAACVVGGPIARFLITRNKLVASGDSVLDVGVKRDGRFKVWVNVGAIASSYI